MRSARRYALAALGCAIFSVIYEHFSHEVYSPWMVGLCAVPLLTGALPAMAIACLKVNVSWSASQLWACAVLTLTLGCCFAGVLEIYGTTSPWLPWFFVLSGGLMVCSVLGQYLGRRCTNP
jgi:hypothetical protein